METGLNAQAIKKFRTVVLGCSLLDLVFPCAGTSLFRRAPASRWGMIWWMGFTIITVMWTMSMMLNALQALLVYVTIWLLVQINTQSRNIESLIHGPSEKEVAIFEQRFSGRRISILLILLVYIVTPTIFLARAGDRVGLLTVRDFGTFPTIFPGETLLVLKSLSRKPGPGELVVWNSEHGNAVGRIIASGGMEVSIKDGNIIVKGKPEPASPKEPVAFPDFQLSAAEKKEADRLQGYSEFHGEMIRPSMAFMRKGVQINGSSVTVPEGSVFILSDNRSTENSVDSRHVGSVPTVNIAGLPLFVVWSPGLTCCSRIERTGAWPR